VLVSLAGVSAPVPTPLTSQDTVDVARYRDIFGRWLASRLDGFVALGSNGEAVLLDEEESDRVIAAVRELVPEDRHFIVGVGRESTVATVRAAQRAGALGADVVLVRTPGFFKSQMTIDAFVRHYTTVADGSPVPVLLYNFTALTGVELPIEAVAVLAGHPNVVGMKESSGDVARIGQLAAAAPARFSLFAGSAASFCAALDAGAVGGILALACVVPDACVRLYELSRTGRREDARVLQEQVAPLARLLGSAHGVAGLKAAMRLVGGDVGPPRPPLLPVSVDAESAIRDAIARVHEVVA
jgi:4-hydroxy-2-oxoglutarate aldolase